MSDMTGIHHVLKPVGMAIMALAIAAPTAFAQVIGPEAASEGDAAFERGDYGEARDHFRSDCDAGEAAACARLGDLYRQGLGGLQDYQAADRAYSRACDGGEAYACHRLAYLVFQGQGLEQDYPRARRLYEKGCDLDDVSACAGFGNMLVAGFGGPKQRNRGAEILRKACLAENDYACDQLRRYGLRRNR
jgi:TPR repeat protein